METADSCFCNYKAIGNNLFINVMEVLEIPFLLIGENMLKNGV